MSTYAVNDYVVKVTSTVPSGHPGATFSVKFAGASQEQLNHVLRKGVMLLIGETMRGLKEGKFGDEGKQLRQQILSERRFDFEVAKWAGATVLPLSKQQVLDLAAQRAKESPEAFIAEMAARGIDLGELAAKVLQKQPQESGNAEGETKEAAG